MKRVPESELETEADLEGRLVRTDGAKIGDVEVLYIGRQESPGQGGIFDILGIDERGNTVVVELKRDLAPRDIVAQALEYAAEIRNGEYEYLDDRYREFLTDEHQYTDPAEIQSLREAHEEYFDLDEPLSEREFNDEQRLVVVGTGFRDVSLNMADFLREHGIDVVAVEYATYRTENEGVELLTTDGIRRPLSEEPTNASAGSDKVDYSELLVPVRNRVFQAVAEMTRHGEPSDMLGRSATRSFEFPSQHPGHPDTVRYRFEPRIVEKGKAVVGIRIWGNDEGEKQRVLDVVAEHADELSGFESSVERGSTQTLIEKVYERTDREPTEEFVETVAKDMARLVEFYHPKFIDEFGS